MKNGILKYIDHYPDMCSEDIFRSPEELFGLLAERALDELAEANYTEEKGNKLKNALRSLDPYALLKSINEFWEGLYYFEICEKKEESDFEPWTLEDIELEIKEITQKVKEREDNYNSIKF